jgi:hypothetical protein
LLVGDCDDIIAVDSTFQSLETFMSQLLDHAVSEARKLPDAEQDAIAALILEEIEDDRRWEETLARSPGKLAGLATRAQEQVLAGRCRTAGFDEL